MRIRDNNQSFSTCDGNWFCMLYDSLGPGTGANLTEFGKDVVDTASYGMKARAEVAKVFE